MCIKKIIMMVTAIYLIINTALADMNANTSMSGNLPPSGDLGSGSMSTVDNDIVVANDVPISSNTQLNPSLISDVQSALSRVVPQSNIVATVDGRIVTLTGSARSNEEVSRAKNAVLDVPGVAGVKTEVRITGQGHY